MSIDNSNSLFKILRFCGCCGKPDLIEVYQNVNFYELPEICRCKDNEKNNLKL